MRELRKENVICFHNEAQVIKVEGEKTRPLTGKRHWSHKELLI